MKTGRVLFPFLKDCLDFGKFYRGPEMKDITFQITFSFPYIFKSSDFLHFNRKFERQMLRLDIDFSFLYRKNYSHIVNFFVNLLKIPFLQCQTNRLNSVAKKTQ